MDVITFPGFKGREIDFAEKERTLRIISHESMFYIEKVVITQVKDDSWSHCLC